MQNKFTDLAVEGVRRLQPYAPGKPISDLQREYGIADIIKLASNENPLGSSPQAMQACRDAFNNLQLYPDGNGFDLKKALADKYKVDTACITLGNGSNDILEFVARVFLKPGSNAVFSRHAFAVYPLVCMAVGAGLNVAAANALDDAMPYGHNLDNMRAQVTADTRVIFIANPNNPTGTWLTRTELSSFIDDIPSNVIIVLDEAYVEYVTETEYPDSIPWLERYPNLVITRTFSKVYGLAGLRIGYSISHPDIANLLNRVRQPFNTNTLAQVAAVAALQDHEHINNSVDSNKRGLRQVSDAMDAMGLDHIPSVGNFISFKTALPEMQVYESLLSDGVIIRPIGNYDLPDYLRVTIGNEQQNERFLHALMKVTGQKI